MANECGVGMLWDAVLNHKASPDGKETSWGVKVDAKDRTKNLSKLRVLETWTKLTFPGRGDKWSDMKYDWKYLSGVDFDSQAKEHGVFKFVAEGKRSDWAEDVSQELRNYAYL
jgi:alpha-amylase